MKQKRATVKIEATFVIPDNAKKSREGNTRLGNGLIIDGEEYVPEIVWFKTKVKKGILNITPKTTDKIQLDAAEVGEVKISSKQIR